MENRTNRTTLEVPIVVDTAVDSAAASLFSHDPDDYIARNLDAQALRATQELTAVPDLSICEREAS